MSSLDDIVVIIQARSKSERVKNKMLREFAKTGSSLLDIAIQKVIVAGVSRENFFVATADDDIESAVGRHGIKIFKRSAASAVEPVTLQVALEWHDKLPEKFKRYVIVNACNPLLTPDTIRDFIRTFDKTDARGMFAVLRRRTFFYDKNWNMLNGFTGQSEHLTTLETKMVVPVFEAAHSLYAGTLSDIGQNVYMGTFRTIDDPMMYEIPEEEFIDIDWPHQFEMAERLYGMKL